MASRPRHAGGDGADVSAVAARIRSRRQELGLTLQEVAGRSEVSKSYLSQIETGKLSPSLGTLERISAALRLPTRALVADPGDPPSSNDHPPNGSAARDDRVTRPIDRRVFVTRKDSRKTVGYPGGVPLELLTPDLQRQLEVTMSSESSGRWRDVQRVGGETEEFVYVVDGEYEIGLGEEVHRLGRGDSMYFYPSSTYRVRRVGTAAARAIWIALPPAF